MNAVRILFFTAEASPTFRADVVELFGKYLPSQGIFSDVVTDRNPKHNGDVIWGGGKALVFNTKEKPLLKHFGKFIHCAKYLLTANKINYQAVQVRDMPFLAVFCLLIARTKGLSFFYWMSYPIPEGQIARARRLRDSTNVVKFLALFLRGRLGKFILSNIVLPYADHVFVQSQRMKLDLMANGLPNNNATPVPMGVSLDALVSAKIDPSTDARLTGRQVIVYLGTLEPTRQIEVLFEMLANILLVQPRALLVIVGDTTDSNHRIWLIDQAKKARVEQHVVWTGWLPMQEAWRYVLAAKVGVSPFPRGNLLDSASPTKVPEYLALGIPVVCNDNPDQQQIIDATGAGLCVPYTAQSFADAIIELLGESADLRATRIEAGQRYIAAHRDYSVIAKYVALTYKVLLEK